MSQESPPGLPNNTNNADQADREVIDLQQELGLHHLITPSQSIWTNPNSPIEQLNPLLVNPAPSAMQRQHLQHERQYQFVQDNSTSTTSGYHRGQFGLENNLPVMLSQQEQQLLLLLQQPWLQQQDLADQSLNLGVDQSSLSTLNSSNARTTTTATDNCNIPLISSNSTPNCLPQTQHNPRSYSVNQDLYCSAAGTFNNLSTNPASNSLHRSSSDLGTRINSYHMDLGDLTGGSASNVPDMPQSSNLYSDKQLGYLTMPTQQNITTSNVSENSFIRSILENTGQSSLISGTILRDQTSLLDNAHLFVSGQETSGYDRAPGTPLSQTPPPKVVQESNIAVPSFVNNNLPNGYLNSHHNKTASASAYSVDSQNDSHSSTVCNSSNKSTNKKIKKINKQNNTKHKQSLQEHEAQSSVTDEIQSKSEYSSQFSFYSTDQNLLFEKMGNLSSQFVNWISSDKSSSANKRALGSINKKEQKNKFNGYLVEKNCKTKTEYEAVVNGNHSDIIVPLPTPTLVSNAALSNKLSYSDVLNSSGKHLLEKGGSSLEQSGYSSGSSQSLENSSSTGNSFQHFKTSADHANPISYSVASLQPYQGPSNKNQSTSHYQPSPVLSSRKNKCSSNIAFGSRVGLDEFNSPTVEELATSYEYSSANSSQAATLLTSLATDGVKQQNSQTTTTISSNNKKKISTSSLLNNKNKVANWKQALNRKSSFINNLCEGSSGCDSDASSTTTTSGNSEGSNKDCDTTHRSSQSPATPQHGSNNNNNNKSGGKNTGLPRRGAATRTIKNNNYNANKKKEQATSTAGVVLGAAQVLLQLCLVYLLQASRWLYHLVEEVLVMSSDLAVVCWAWCWCHGVLWGAVCKGVLGRRWEKLAGRLRKYWRPKGSEGRFPRLDTPYLEQHLLLPTTGEMAMKRLLECKGRDNYSILGVTPDATQEDIRRYYRRQAFLVHPDKNKTPGAEEAFKVLGHAFEEVGEPAKRSEYDRRVLGESQLGEAWDKLSDLLKDLERKLEEASNMIRCPTCPKKHKRVIMLDRPIYAARYCAKCNIHHPAREGEIWAESWLYGLRWRYLACMEGAVYNISEWASCQTSSLRQLQANTHIVQYRIISGKKKSSQHHRPPHHDLPTDPEIEEFFNQLYKDGKFSSSFPTPSSQSGVSQGGESSFTAAPPGRRRADRPHKRNRRS